MLSAYNHRASSVEIRSQNIVRAAQSVISEDVQLKDPRFIPTSAFWLPESALARVASQRLPGEWVLAYKDITAAIGERTMIAAVLPNASTNFTVRCVFLRDVTCLLETCFLANLDARTFDDLARQATRGLAPLSDYILKQLPVLPPSAYASADITFISPARPGVGLHSVGHGAVCGRPVGRCR